jgi:hypothetical protein
MEPKACARPECPRSVGAVAFKIYQKDEEYCSRECVDQVLYDAKRAARRKGGKSQDQQEDAMKIPAEDFGAAGVVRHACDNPDCGKPLGILPDGTVTLAWKGQYGEYCSNDCLNQIEENMTDEQTATATAAAPAPKPITAGKTATPKTTKKAAPASKPAKPAAEKKVAAPKAAKPAKAPKAAKAPNGKFADDAVITVKSTENDKRGKRADALKVFKTGMTVGKFKEAMAKKDLNTHISWALNTGVAEGLIAIK